MQHAVYAVSLRLISVESSADARSLRNQLPSHDALNDDSDDDVLDLGSFQQHSSHMLGGMMS